MDLEKEVKEALEAVRPSLQNDGGDVVFNKIEGNTVYVTLTGSCAGCAYAAMTLKGGIERMLKVRVDPNLEVVNLAQFDH
ncbi:MAG: NifU family protein [Sphaerochaetaceae bacterium]|nr:NifU family protein [Sphaerochaetaceae bacterium]